MRQSRHVCHHGNGGGLDRHAVEHFLEAVGSRLHERRVVGARHVQDERALRTRLVGDALGFLHGLAFAGKHRLGGGVQIGDLDARDFTDLLQFVHGKADYADHAPVACLARVLHEAPPGFQYAQRVFETQRSRHVQGGPFPEAQSRRTPRRQVSRPHSQCRVAGNACHEDSRLAVVRSCQLVCRSLETDVRERVAEGLVGPFEERPALRIGLGQVLAHADKLGALPRENNSPIAHVLLLRTGIPPPSSALSLQRPTFNAQCPMFSVRYSAFDVRTPTLTIPVPWRPT